MIVDHSILQSWKTQMFGVRFRSRAQTAGPSVGSSFGMGGIRDEWRSFPKPKWINDDEHRPLTAIDLYRTKTSSTASTS